MSTDLTPIEPVWDILGKRARGHGPLLKTHGELGATLQKER